MGFSTIFASIAFIVIFCTGLLYIATFQHGMVRTSQAYHDQVENTQKTNAEAIEITVAQYAYGPTILWIDDLYSEFIRGDTSGGTVVAAAGSVEIASAPFASSTYEGYQVDTGVAGTNYTTISWTSVEPALTNVTFQARSGGSLAALQATSYTGPDGTGATFYSSSGAAFHASLSNNRFFQYIAYLNTADIGETPTLQEVTIGMARPSGVISLNLTNSGTVKLTPNETDIYVDTLRIQRNLTKRTLHVHDASGQALWDPGEVMEIHVFTTLAGSAQVTVSNDAAKDATVVN